MSEQQQPTATTTSETGRRRTRRLWDVAPPNSTTSAVSEPATIRNPLVENLTTGPDGTVTAEYVINDCRHRGLLTRKTVHVQLQAATRTTAVVRGRYLTDSKLSTPSDRSLHLTLSSTSMADMILAVQWIDRVIETGSTYNGSESVSTPTPSQPTAVKDADGNLTLSVPVPIPRAAAEARKFALVAQLLGPDRAYLQHIEAQSKTTIALCNQNRPLAVLLSFEIKAKTTTAINDAKTLIDDLIQTVRTAFEAAKPAPRAPPPTPPAPKPVAPAPSPRAMPHPAAPYPMAPAYPPYLGPAPMMPPMYGVPVPYPGMAPYYYAPPPGYGPYAGTPMAPPISNENQFPDRAEVTAAASVAATEPNPKRAKVTAALPDDNDREFQKFKQQMTTAPETISRPIVGSASASTSSRDIDAERIMKEHLGL